MTNIIITAIISLISGVSFAVIEVCLWKFDTSIFRHKNKPFWDSHHEPESEKKMFLKYPITAHHIFKTLGVGLLFVLPVYPVSIYYYPAAGLLWIISMTLFYRRLLIAKKYRS